MPATLRLRLVVFSLILVSVVAVAMLVSGGSTFAAGAAPSTPVRLNAADTERLGWSPQRLDGVFGYAASLGTDTLMIVTDGETVGAMGDLGRQYHVHSVRKALLSALVGQHVGSGDRQIPLDATLAELGIDDRPNPLTPLQKQAIVLHLVKSVSGINHAAAAEGGLMKEKQLRLGTGENPARDGLGLQQLGLQRPDDGVRTAHGHARCGCISDRHSRSLVHA